MEEQEVPLNEEYPHLKTFLDVLEQFRTKAQRAVNLLRQQKERIQTLELENGELRAQLKERDPSLGLSKGGIPVDVADRLLYLTPDEREALERQIDELISRINTHLDR